MNFCVTGSIFSLDDIFQFQVLEICRTYAHCLCQFLLVSKKIHSRKHCFYVALTVISSVIQLFLNFGNIAYFRHFRTSDSVRPTDRSTTVSVHGLKFLF